MKQKAKGSGLIFAVVLLFVILGMVVALSSVTVLETKMSQKSKSSVGAFYNSESGVEWALNQIASTPGDSSISALGTPPSSFGSSVYYLDENGKVLDSSKSTNIVSMIKAVRSVGTQTAGDTTQRAIEAAVAAGGTGTWVEWGADNSCSGGGTKIYTGDTVIQISGGGAPFCLKGGLASFGDIQDSTNFTLSNFQKQINNGITNHPKRIPCTVCIL